MKRDWELVRGILLQVEAAPAGTHIQEIETEEGKTFPEVAEHVRLLAEANLLDASAVLKRETSYQ